MSGPESTPHRQQSDDLMARAYVKVRRAYDSPIDPHIIGDGLVQAAALSAEQGKPAKLRIAPDGRFAVGVNGHIKSGGILFKEASFVATIRIPQSDEAGENQTRNQDEEENIQLPGIAGKPTELISDPQIADMSLQAAMQVSAQAHANLGVDPESIAHNLMETRKTIRSILHALFTPPEENPTENDGLMTIFERTKSSVGDAQQRAMDMLRTASTLYEKLPEFSSGREQEFSFEFVGKDGLRLDY